MIFPPPPRVVLTVLSAWRNAGLAAALAVLTLLAGLAGPSDPAAAQTNNNAMGAPEVTGALRVSATLGVDTSGISDADGLTNPSFTYSWIRVAADDSESDLATGPAWTLRTEDEGTRIKVRVTFNDDLGTTESLTSAVTAPIAAAAKGTGVTQVQNTDRTADSTASALTVAAPGLAQAFTTGANVGGYTVNEVGVDFRTVAGTSTAGGELAATLHADDAGLPGDELCALTDPGSFNASGVHYFDAPRVGAGACVTLAASTTYHVVVNRSAFAGGSIEMGGTAATDEDTLALARGWTIADTRAALSSGSWASVASAGPLRIDVVAAAVNNATGEPVITGALRAGETLTADISGIGDPEGLTTSPQIIYNWRHDEFGGDVIHSFTTDSFTTSSTYTLTDDDLGKNIAVRVTFDDDLDNEESLLSDATGAVAAAVPARCSSPTPAAARTTPGRSTRPPVGARRRSRPARRAAATSWSRWASTSPAPHRRATTSPCDCTSPVPVPCPDKRWGNRRCARWSTRASSPLRGCSSSMRPAPARCARPSPREPSTPS